MKNLVYIAILIFTFSCSQEKDSENTPIASENNTSYSATLTELSDQEYPDNPDVMVRHNKYTSSIMEEILFIKNGDTYDIKILPSNDGDDTVFMSSISLMEFIPTIPDYAKKDEYMSLVAVLNQEWNRNQVKWNSSDLENVTSKNFVVNGETITRIDIARNCLNSYLWELIFYANEEGKDKACYHGWFDFPKNLYAELFEERNNEKFEDYAKYLENWLDPPNKELNLGNIREVITKKASVPFQNRSNEMYPLKGERKKKEIEIIYPTTYSKMSDFHTDSAKFATFSQPGYYNREDPRHTELGRFQKINNVAYHSTKSHSGDVYDELVFEFERHAGEKTMFVFGGINLNDLPHLSAEDANSGIQYSMGIGNHPFYEDCNSHEKCCSKINPYFGVLLDVEGNWLDSHKIGIDGPLLHLDEKDSNILHVWLLSFERHALVGHYEVYLNK